MKKSLRLAILMMGFVLGFSSRAAVTFTAGGGEVAPGNFSVTITVNSDLSPPVNYWGNAGFNLVWDASVLSLQGMLVDVTGSPLPITSDNFFSPSVGQLNFTWFAAGDGYQVANGSTLFSVNFTAVGGIGTSTLLSFTSLANIALTDVDGNSLTFTSPSGINGLIQVVPEPVDYALGLFAMIVVGTSRLLNKGLF